MKGLITALAVLAVAAAPSAARPKPCSRRVRIKLPARVRRATVYVNGRRVKRLRGRDVRVPVTIRRRAKGTTRVRIVARLKNGRRVVRSRRYRAC